VEIFVGEDFGDWACGDDAHVEEHGVVEVGGDGLEIVVDDDDGFALLAEFSEDFDDGGFGGGVDAGEGFVHEVEVCFLDQCAGEEDALLLASGELGDLAVCVVGESHAIEGFHGGGFVGFADGFEPADFSVEAHADDIECADGEVPVDGFALGDIADVGAGVFVGFAPELDGSCGGGDESEACFDEGAFSGAVWADDGDEGAGGRVVIDIPEDGLAVVGDGHGVNREGVVGGVFWSCVEG